MAKTHGGHTRKIIIPATSNFLFAISDEDGTKYEKFFNDQIRGQLENSALFCTSYLLYRN
jgi:hypothetical protein